MVATNSIGCAGDSSIRFLPLINADLIPLRISAQICGKFAAKRATLVL
jgi:hypothetical protein